MTPAEIEETINVHYYTGISSVWKVSESKTFKSNDPNPCPCSDDPEHRMHYLMVC
jgi:hypothetical protein